MQSAWHALSPDYSPTEAGQNGLVGSPVLGVRCVDANTLTIFSGMLDFNKNASGAAPFSSVSNGAVVAQSYVTPYTIVMTATFVPNPTAPPAYYLKLQQVITNTSSTESLPWGFEFANYVPGSFTSQISYPSSCTALTSNCYSSSTPHLLGGMYPNAQLTNGVAFYTAPQTNWNGSTRGWVELRNSTGVYLGVSREIHIWDAYWSLGPGTQRSQTWYVLVGDWQKALNFSLAN